MTHRFLFFFFMPYYPSESRSQSLRYPCPADRENENLWEDPFELGISLAINRACAVPPKVDKQAKNNNFVPSFLIFYAARDGCASSGYDRFESEHGVQNTRKVFASTSKSTSRPWML